MSLLAALALAQAAAPEIERLSDDEAVARASVCGIELTETFYDERSREHYIFAGDPVIQDEQLQCLAETFVKTDRMVSLPEQYWPRYMELVQALWAPHVHEEAHARFVARDMLDEVEAIPFGTLSEVETITAIETLCGPASQGALTTEFGAISFSPGWMRPEDARTEEAAEAFSCVTRSLLLADVTFGFIGNGRLPDTE